MLILIYFYFFRSHLTLRDMHATGLGTFQIDNLTVEMTSVLLQRYMCSFDITIPTVEASAGLYRENLTNISTKLNNAVLLRIECYTLRCIVIRHGIVLWPVGKYAINNVKKSRHDIATYHDRTLLIYSSQFKKKIQY